MIPKCATCLHLREGVCYGFSKQRPEKRESTACSRYIRRLRADMASLVVPRRGNDMRWK